jgi:oligogalacturonide transport system substrate-binding protein
MKRRITAFFAAAAFCLCTACGGETQVNEQVEQTEISFSWWGNDSRNEYTIQAIKEFEQLYPNIKVKCRYSEWSGYQTRNNASMASNTESDVMQINYAWIEQYSPDGDGFYDLSTLSDYFDFSNFSDEDLSYGMQNGKLNAVPIALNTQTVYINKTVYAEYGLDVPSTWDDFFAAAKVMNGECYPLSMAQKSAWFFCVAYAEQQSGKQIISQDGELNFTADDIKIMLELYCRLINEKVMPQVEYFDKLNVDTGKYAGVAAWLSDASNQCDDAIANGYEIVVADYPSFDGNVSGWYAKPATMYAISNDTEHPKEAALLLNFLMNSREMSELQGIEKGIPISASARQYLEETDKLSGIQYEAFLKLNDSEDTDSAISAISPYFESEDLIDAFNEACNDVLYEKSTADKQAKLLESEFAEIIAAQKG